MPCALIVITSRGMVTMLRTEYHTGMPSLHPRGAARFALALSVTTLAAHVARAHFVLQSPASWRTQGPQGDPQKEKPCGGEGTEPATGVVTSFSPGETITITLDETVFHPGHYRVALAVNDRSELPAEPTVTPGATACGSVPILTSPTFPVLADGLLQHTAPFSGAQSFQVTLPSHLTCTHCTLQVLEFMSNHGAPCFYHHCADISIQASSRACTTDADCADNNACTSDRCNLDTSTCEHLDTSTSCNDGDACTEDTCSAGQGCGNQPLALADVKPGFLGVLPVVPCSTENVPPAIRTLFDQASTFVTRAPRNPAKAQRLLNRASKRLRGAAQKVTNVQGRRISAGCGTALSALLDDAQMRVQCLLGGV